MADERRSQLVGSRDLGEQRPAALLDRGAGDATQALEIGAVERRSERSQSRKRNARTPSSVPFSTSHDARLGRGAATRSSSARRGSSAGAAAPSRTIARRRSTETTSPWRARPRPSTTRTGSPVARAGGAEEVVVGLALDDQLGTFELDRRDQQVDGQARPSARNRHDDHSPSIASATRVRVRPPRTAPAISRRSTVSAPE